MPIQLTCPCGKRLQVADAHAGMPGQCPACGRLLPIPRCDGTVTGVAPPAGQEAQPELDLSELFGPLDLLVSDDRVAPTAASAAHGEPSRARADDNGQLTAAGCVLTLLTFVVILGVALPIVGWREPETGQPLPRSVAIFTPFLIGAVVYGIGSLLLRLIGLRVWSTEKPTQRGNDSEAGQKG
jgi:hypothetical protein